MDFSRKQAGYTSLALLGVVLLLIIAVTIFMNQRNQQKMREISAQSKAASEKIQAEAIARQSAYHYSNNGSNSQVSAAETDRSQTASAKDQQMDKNIQRMNNYNRELFAYSNQQNDLIQEWNILNQAAFEQDRLAIRTTLEKMVNVYNKLDKLATPECKTKEKHQWMRSLQEDIERLNVSDSSAIVRFSPVDTPDVKAYDCFANMPEEK